MDRPSMNPSTVASFFQRRLDTVIYTSSWRGGSSRWSSPFRWRRAPTSAGRVRRRLFRIACLRTKHLSAPLLAARADVVPPTRRVDLPSDAGEILQPVLLVARTVKAAGRVAVAGYAVDQFPQDVAVAGVASGVEEHCQQHRPQRDRGAGPVLTGRIELEVLDGPISCCGRGTVGGDQLFRCLLWLGVHVTVVAPGRINLPLPREAGTFAVE